MINRVYQGACQGKIALRRNKNSVQYITVTLKRDIFCFFVPRSYELWCGQTEGHLTILDAGRLSTSQVTVCHLQDPLPMAPVTHAVTYDLHIQEQMGLQHVWSYVQPGRLE